MRVKGGSLSYDMKWEYRKRGKPIPCKLLNLRHDTYSSPDVDVSPKIDNLESNTLDRTMPENILSCWQLSDSDELRRVPVRPHSKRQSNFESDFDDRTVIYDAFCLGNSNDVMIISPALNNLEGYFTRSLFYGDHAESLQSSFVGMDRAFRTVIRSERPVKNIHIQSQVGNHVLAVRPFEGSLFKGKNVVYTLSRNNDLEWIRDWIIYYRRIHQADAFLIFDNGSDAYSFDDLRSAIYEAGAGAVVKVVSWPYKYGPSGGEYNTWDSDFCQYGAFEVARWRFLAEARAVLNADIDELLFPTSIKSIFDLAVECDSGYITFPGRWVANICELGGKYNDRTGGRRYRDFFHFERSSSACPAKWVLTPVRCTINSQWKVHEVTKMEASKEKGIFYLHFRGINTNWKYNRGPVRFEDGLYLKDTELQQFLDCVWASSS